MNQNQLLRLYDFMRFLALMLLLPGKTSEVTEEAERHLLT